MASIRKRGENSYLIVVSRGYDYEGNRLKSAQKTVHPPMELKPKQRENWLQEQAVLFEREVHHTPEPVNKSVTLAKYIDHWLADVAPNKLAKTTYSRDQQDVRRIQPALGHYKLTDLRKEVIRDFYEEMRIHPGSFCGRIFAGEGCAHSGRKRFSLSEDWGTRNVFPCPWPVVQHGLRLFVQHRTALCSQWPHGYHEQPSIHRRWP